jgi:high-affinity K+ transport system ATPase subunit B
MKRSLRFLMFPLLFAVFALSARAQEVAGDAAKLVQPSPPSASAASLANRDVLDMLAAKLVPEIVVAKIRNSACLFDTSPEALKALREAGAPDSVILAVVEAPRAAAPAKEKKIVALRLPAGVRVELESAYRISSQEVRVGDLITFRVLNPVLVDGAVVIEKGAIATAEVTKASRGGHFGRAGRLAWKLHEVTAADGTRVPLDSQGRVVGDSKGAKVATQMAITAAALPLIAPVALLHGFKRGENAYLPEGKRFDAFTRVEAVVKAGVEQEN